MKIHTHEMVIQKIDGLLNNLAKQRSPEFAQKIRAILYSNLERGRIDFYISGEIDLINEYAQRVVKNYDKFSAYINTIQIERNEAEWQPLFENMQVWAYNYFLAINHPPGKMTMESAIARATEAAIVLLDAHFPYDTPFAPWARVIVVNTCKKFVRKTLKVSNKSNLNPIDLDKLENLLTSSQKKDWEDQHIDLISAIEQLTDTRKEVILLSYFEGLSPDEIASRINKTKQAVYMLRFHAIEDLRKILVSNWNKQR